MDFTNYFIAPAQFGQPVVKTGEKFYKATRYEIQVPKGATLILSSQPDGKGDVFVDDTVTLIAKEESTVLATYEHDYSNGCSGKITGTAPVDLTQLDGFNKLGGKTIAVEIVMKDKCGGFISSSNYYFCVGA
ncbi:hypothetical protein [Kordia sp.]|uniref:hypothetical protein n=1 Tax=Kordia sp. TaxID=1965332 RepID=UPI0025B8F017|nr:hypothetical protein [Kordia sp.]MCH2192818.1 hypothetical protein [Kordia sp.]